MTARFAAAALGAAASAAQSGGRTIAAVAVKPLEGALPKAALRQRRLKSIGGIATRTRRSRT